MSLYKGKDKILNSTVNVPITTTIGASSTDEQIPSAKAVETRISKREVISDVDLNTIVDEGKYYVGTGCTNAPILGGYLDVRRFDDNFISQMLIHYNATQIQTVYIRTKCNSFSPWVRLVGTKVTDVESTSVTIPNDLFQTFNPDVSYIKYEVVNGIAFVYFSIREAKFVSSGNSRNITVPKLKNSFNHTIIGESCDSNLTILANGNNMQIWTSGNVDVITNYSACISYPVAES